MRQTLLFVVAAIVALCLQAVVLPRLPIGPFIPDLMVILVVDMGLRAHNALAPILVFAAGYALDACSGTRLGLNAFALTLIYLLIYELTRHAWLKGRGLAIALVFVATLLHTWVVLILAGGVREIFPPRRVVLDAALLQAILTTVLAPLVFRALASGQRILRLPVRVAGE